MGHLFMTSERKRGDNLTRSVVKLPESEKAALQARADALGVTMSEAYARGAALYLTSLELQQRPKPKRGRPPKKKP